MKRHVGKSKEIWYLGTLVAAGDTPAIDVRGQDHLHRKSIF